MRRLLGGMAAPFTGLWAGLSPRERTLLRLLGLAFVFVVTLALFYLRSARLSAIERKIDRVTDALVLLRTKGGDYAERRKKASKQSRRFSDTPLMFSSHIEAVAARVPDVEVTNQEEQAPVELGAGLRRRTFEFDIRSVSYETLFRFLAEAEQVPGHVVLVDGLRIRSASPNEDRVHAAVRLSTWERAAEEGGAGGGTP